MRAGPSAKSRFPVPSTTGEIHKRYSSTRPYSISDRDQASAAVHRGLLFDRSERPGCDYRRNWRLRRQVQHSAMWVTPTGEGEGFASQLAHSSRNNGPDQENSGPHSLCHSEIDELVRVETCTSPGGSVSDEFVRRRPGPSEGVSRRSVGLTA